MKILQIKKLRKKYKIKMLTKKLEYKIEKKL